MSGKVIKIKDRAGVFAEDKDIARDIRLHEITPMLDKGKKVVVDFDGVEGATQSFVHALISELFRQYGGDILDSIAFKDCNSTIQQIVSTVADYMQES